MPKSRSLDAVGGDQELRLEVAVDDEILMRVVDGRRRLQEKRSRARDRQPVPVAVGVDGHAVDVLHHQIGRRLRCARRRAGARCSGARAGEDLPLGWKRRRKRGVLRAGSEINFKPADLLVKALVVALGEVDHAHAARGQVRDEAIGASVAGRVGHPL